MKAIIFEPKFQAGEIVQSILDSELIYVVLGYSLYNIDENGVAQTVNYICGDGIGGSLSFKEFELKMHVLQS